MQAKFTIWVIKINIEVQSSRFTRTPEAHKPQAAPKATRVQGSKVQGSTVQRFRDVFPNIHYLRYFQ